LSEEYGGQADGHEGKAHDGLQEEASGVGSQVR
jgi:hypothetical protein